MMIFVWVGICWIFAAIFIAIANTLAFKFKKSIFKNLNEEWWNPAKSWKNMFKDRMPSKGSKFLGSTVFFKFTTDAWHLFQFLGASAVALSVVVVFSSLFDLNWIQNIVLFLCLMIIKETVNYYFIKMFREHF